VETGLALSPPSAIPTYTGIFSQTIVNWRGLISRIVAITGSVDGTGLDKFSQEFPGRFMMWVLLSSTQSPLPPAGDRRFNSL